VIGNGIDGVQPGDEAAGAGLMPGSARLSRGMGPTGTGFVDGESLPFTGLPMWLLLVTGGLALGSGIYLQRAVGPQEVGIRSL
jgi:hypothetical protein